MNRADVDLIFKDFKQCNPQEFHEPVFEKTGQGLMGKPLLSVYDAGVAKGVSVVQVQGFQPV